MIKQKSVFKSGNEMAAQAASDINYHIMPYFPISPSTEIAQNLDMMFANGLNTIKLVPIDGEHESLGACYGAATTGARVFNATSSNGLAYMVEQLPVISATRYPMVLNLVNRAISGPLNIHCDHSDLYLTLDLGWLILTASTPQAVYDQNIIALKLSEHPDIQLPAIVSYDGYITSHQKHNVEVFENHDDVRNFLGEKVFLKNKYVSDLKNPITIGSHMVQDHMMDNKYQLEEAMAKSLKIYKEIQAEYAKMTNRSYAPVEIYGDKNAEIAIFLINSSYEIAKEAIDEANAKGKKVKVIKTNLVRPFPLDDFQEELKTVKTLIIGERNANTGSEANNLSADVINAALRYNPEIKTQVLVYGLGGKEIFTEDVLNFIEIAQANLQVSNNELQKQYYGLLKGENSKADKIQRHLEYHPEDYKIGGFEYNFDEEEQILKVKTPLLRALTKKPKRILGGHNACPGCGIFPGVELFLRGLEGDVIMLNQTGCAYVVTAGYPNSAFKGHYIHNLFQNGSAALGGVVDAIYELKARGEIEFSEDATFVMLSGDGGMDIGMGSAIGAALRNHKMIILEYDNEGYMNTGAQLSYSTPIGHRTSTSNVGKYEVGKQFDHKDTVQIMAATNIPYVFTGVDAFADDLIKKAAKAQWYAKHYGLVYGKILIACPLNWKSEEKDGSNVLEAAVNCNFFPLYEIELGKTKITYNPEKLGKNVPASEWLKYMGKSRHLLKPENKEILNHFEEIIDQRWTKIKIKDEHPSL